MLISVAKAEDGVFYDFNGEVTLPDSLIADRLAKYNGATKVCGKYVLTDGDVIVYGECNTKVDFECDNCLKKVERNIKYKLSASFSLTEKEGFNYTYSGNQVDIDEAVAEEFCLALPTKVLCRTDCKGICPVCGINLNDKQCGCVTEQEEEKNPFATLKEVFKENDN